MCVCVCVCVRACVRGCAPVGTLVCVCVCVCPGLWRTWLVSGVGFGLFLGSLHCGIILVFSQLPHE